MTTIRVVIDDISVNGVKYAKGQLVDVEHRQGIPERFLRDPDNYNREKKSEVSKHGNGKTKR